MPIDDKKYPPNWTTEIVPRILKRDKHQCKFCDVANSTSLYSLGLRVQDSDGRYKTKRFWITTEADVKRMRPFALDLKVISVVLTVAHLDHDETNFDVGDDRLAALCQWCHLNYDASEKFRRALAKSERKTSYG